MVQTLVTSIWHGGRIVKDCLAHNRVSRPWSAAYHFANHKVLRQFCIPVYALIITVRYTLSTSTLVLHCYGSFLASFRTDFPESLPSIRVNLSSIIDILSSKSLISASFFRSKFMQHSITVNKLLRTDRSHSVLLSSCCTFDKS